MRQRAALEHVMPDLRKFNIDALNYPDNGYRVWLKAPVAS